MNSYGYISDSIVDAKANGEDGEIVTIMSDDRLGTTSAPLACSKAIDEKPIIMDKNSDNTLSTNNAPLARNKVVDEEPFVGMQFEDDDGAFQFYSSYAGKVGFCVRKLPKGKCPNSGVVERREFCCARRTLSSDLANCDAHMSCRLVKGKFTVISFDKEHNHNLFPGQLSLAKAQASLNGSGAASNNSVKQRLMHFFALTKEWSIKRTSVQRKRANLSFEILSWEPRAFLFHDFLSKEECEHLIQLGQPHLKRSLANDSLTGKGIVSSGRTSFGAWIRRGNDEIVTNIEKRIAEATFLPVEHGEQLNVLRYEVGQKIDPHHDAFSNLLDHLKQNGGQRVATFLMYLSEVEEGGETIFPKAKGKVETVPWCDGSSQKFKSGVVVKPKMGNAVLFWNVKPDGTLDTDSLHGGCPVIKGNKWCCTKIIRASVFNLKK